jgi:hypothetical protein
MTMIANVLPFFAGAYGYHTYIGRIRCRVIASRYKRKRLSQKAEAASFLSGNGPNKVKKVLPERREEAAIL